MRAGLGTAVGRDARKACSAVCRTSPPSQMADPNLFDFEGLESARIIPEDGEDAAAGTNLEAEF